MWTLGRMYFPMVKNGKRALCVCQMDHIHMQVRRKKNKLKSGKCLYCPGVKTTCQKDRDIKRLQPVVSMKIPSQYVRASGPWWSTLRCDVNGGYSPVQCLARTSFCWCVDKYGREIPRTRISGTPRCGPMGEQFWGLFFVVISAYVYEMFIHVPPQPVWPCVKRSVRRLLDGREYKPAESLYLLANQTENTMLFSAIRPLVCVGVLIRVESKSKAQGRQVYQAVEWWVGIHIFPVFRTQIRN